MTKYETLLIILLCLSFTLTGCQKPVPPPASQSATATPALVEDKRVTSVGVVKVSPQPVEITAGGSGEATVGLTIENGYHINANPPAYSYLIATALEIPSANGISSGSVTYPKALNRKFVFAEKPLAVYEGETKIKAMLKADKSATPGQHSLAAKLRIQACDEQVCYPPGTLDLVIPVSIK